MPNARRPGPAAKIYGTCLKPLPGPNLIYESACFACMFSGWGGAGLLAVTLWPMVDRCNHNRNRNHCQMLARIALLLQFWSRTPPGDLAVPMRTGRQEVGNS